ASDRSTILTLCHSAGFRQAKFHWTAEPTAQEHEVNLKYTLQLGEQEFVRDVLFSGIRNTKPKLINSNMKVAKGDPLSFSALREAQHELYDIGVFAKVNTAVQNGEGAE